MSSDSNQSTIPRQGTVETDRMTYQYGLAGSLYAIETKEEWRDIGRAICLAMSLRVDAKPLKEEWNAMLRLVVHYFRHCDCQSGVYRCVHSEVNSTSLRGPASSPNGGDGPESPAGVVAQPIEFSGES